MTEVGFCFCFCVRGLDSPRLFGPGDGVCRIYEADQGLPLHDNVINKPTCGQPVPRELDKVF